MRRLPCYALLLALAAGGLGCVLVGPPLPAVVEPVREVHPGPPPHAPAWGYRQKHREREDAGQVALRFDPMLGVDVVVGQTDLYFSHGVFLRFRSGLWEASLRMDGPWRPRDDRSVPPGLRAHYREAPPGQGRRHHRREEREERGAAHPGWE